jgi:hypothetical protein
VDSINYSNFCPFVEEHSIFESGCLAGSEVHIAAAGLQGRERACPAACAVLGVAVSAQQAVANGGLQVPESRADGLRPGQGIAYPVPAFGELDGRTVEGMPANLGLDNLHLLDSHY